jgi:hypothetical protein
VGGLGALRWGQSESTGDGSPGPPKPRKGAPLLLAVAEILNAKGTDALGLEVAPFFQTKSVLSPRIPALKLRVVPYHRCPFGPHACARVASGSRSSRC